MAISNQTSKPPTSVTIQPYTGWIRMVNRGQYHVNLETGVAIIATKSSKDKRILTAGMAVRLSYDAAARTYVILP